MIEKVDTNLVAHTTGGDEISVELEPQGFIIERKGDVNLEGKITLTPQELGQLVTMCEEKYPNARWVNGDAEEAQHRG